MKEEDGRENVKVPTLLEAWREAGRAVERAKAASAAAHRAAQAAAATAERSPKRHATHRPPSKQPRELEMLPGRRLAMHWPPRAQPAPTIPTLKAPCIRPRRR